jgi:excisionase family DNA binding protein
VEQYKQNIPIPNGCELLDITGILKLEDAKENQNKRENNMNNLLTTNQVAQRLKITPSRVRQLILAGRLPATKIGRDLFVKEQDLKNFKRMPRGRPKK